MAPVTELQKSVNDNVTDIKKSLNGIGKPKKEEKPAQNTSSDVTPQPEMEAAPASTDTTETSANTVSNEETPVASQPVSSEEAPGEALQADSADAIETA
jgi:hypothetical protein